MWQLTGQAQRALIALSHREPHGHRRHRAGQRGAEAGAPCRRGRGLPCTAVCHGLRISSASTSYPPVPPRRRQCRRRPAYRAAGALGRSRRSSGSAAPGQRGGTLWRARGAAEDKRAGRRRADRRPVRSTASRPPARQISGLAPPVRAHTVSDHRCQPSAARCSRISQWELKYRRMAEWCTPARWATAVNVTVATPDSSASERAASMSVAARRRLFSAVRARWNVSCDTGQRIAAGVRVAGATRRRYQGPKRRPLYARDVR